MSLRARIAVLTTAGLIAAGYTASLLVDPLCSVFRSKRHYAGVAESHTVPTTSTIAPASIAAHR